MQATATPMVVLCQCEHTDHWEGKGHKYLEAEAGTYRAHFVGQICDACAAGHLRSYVLLTEPGCGPRLTIVYIEARAWIDDITDWFAEEELSHAEIKRIINKHYEGGWDAFVLSCEPLFTEE